MPDQKILDIASLEKFKELIADKKKLFVVHFWASWANQCAPMDEAIKVLADEVDCGTATFVRIEAEEAPDIAMEYDVAAVPTCIFFRAGEILDRVEGAKAADMSKMVRNLVAQKVTVPSQQASTETTKQIVEEPIEHKLKRLINASACMLFMKGDPTTPKCGFSRQTIEILNGIDAEFGTFDILKDETVRQELKTYSNWPTYPQIYIKGELIGGLDIIKEMMESNELQPMIPKKKVENGSTVSLEQRMKDTINKGCVMVFMKGDRNEPRCGFSRQLMEILQETEVEFSTFDILTDEDIRQGLKKFSNWPTYPQVYVKGELIGGLDIIKELKEEEELISTLKGE